MFKIGLKPGFFPTQFPRWADNGFIDSMFRGQTGCSWHGMNKGVPGLQKVVVSSGWIGY